MISRVIKKTVDLDVVQKVDQLEGPLYQLEESGHTFEITCLMNGAAADVSGTVSARFLRADGSTVLCDGSLEGNVASVTLPQSCYNVPGRFGLVIFINGDDVTTAVYAVAGNVYRSTSDTYVDPTGEIPSLENVIAEAENAEAWAVGTKGGTPVDSSAPQYENNAKYWSDHAFSATPSGYEELVSDVADLDTDVSDLKSALSFIHISEGIGSAGAYSDVNGVLTFTANQNALAYAVDLSDYVGKIVNVQIDSSATSSVRLSAIVNSSDEIYEKATETEIKSSNHGQNFHVTSGYHILKVSHYNSVGSSIKITVLDNLMYNAALVPEIRADLTSLQDSVGRIDFDVSTGTQNGYFTVSSNTISITTNSNSRCKIIDMSSYVGKRVWVKISTTATTSSRVTAICTSQGGVGQSYTEADINVSANGVYFDITAEYCYLYISWYYIVNKYPAVSVIYGLYDEVADLTANVRPAVVYVDSAGSASGVGTSASPYNTIQKAINSGAEIVKVKAGTYGAFSVSGRDYPLTVMLWEMPSYVASATEQDLPKIHISDSGTYNGVAVENCADVRLFDIWADSSPRYNFNLVDIQHLELTRCYANTNSTANFSTFRFVNVNAVVRDCRAWESQLDGFNIHGYGNTEFINCVAFDCGDDGISHHDSCTGCIIGGEFYGNGKGGISSPYGGAKIDVHGAYCHDNMRYGFYADSDATHPNIYARVSDCLFVDNTDADIYAADGTIIAWNTLYKTKSIQATATFTEYNNTVLA